MSSYNIGRVGDVVTLQGMSSTKLYVGDVMVCYGYIQSGQPQTITIGSLTDCFIVDQDGTAWKLLSEHGDDFYVVVP